MSEEALRRASLMASLALRRSLGLVASLGLGLGVCGAMGSVLMFSTALPPVASHDALKGFNDATSGLYDADASDAQQARLLAAAAAGTAALGPMRSAARRAA